MRGHVVAGLPAGTVAGRATSYRCMCLIHSLMQVAAPSPAGAGQWADEIHRCEVIRDHIDSAHPEVAGDFLALEDFWAPILVALGRTPAQYSSK